MRSNTSSPRPWSLSCISVLFLCLLQCTVEATHIETYSDADCKTKLNGWSAANGYPSGRCTSIRREGNFTTFMITDPDPGCAITLYEKDTTEDICSGDSKVKNYNTCYSAEWYYYSIDQCFTPSSTSSSSSTTSKASTSSTSGAQTHTTLQTQTSASSSATATSTPVSQGSGTNLGAIVGGTIGGVAAGAILAAVGIIAFLRYRRTKKARLEQRNQGGSAPPPYGHGGAVEVAAKEAPVTVAPASPAVELGDERAYELQETTVHEMPDSARGAPKSPSGTVGSGQPILGGDRKG